MKGEELRGHKDWLRVTQLSRHVKPKGDKPEQV